MSSLHGHGCFRVADHDFLLLPRRLSIRSYAAGIRRNKPPSTQGKTDLLRSCYAHGSHALGACWPWHYSSSRLPAVSRCVLLGHGRSPANLFGPAGQPAARVRPWEVCVGTQNVHVWYVVVGILYSSQPTPQDTQGDFYSVGVICRHVNRSPPVNSLSYRRRVLQPEPCTTTLSPHVFFHTYCDRRLPC
jgi:hypothetical protein